MNPRHMLEPGWANLELAAEGNFRIASRQFATAGLFVMEALQVIRLLPLTGLLMALGTVGCSRADRGISHVQSSTLESQPVGAAGAGRSAASDRDGESGLAERRSATIAPASAAESPNDVDDLDEQIAAMATAAAAKAAALQALQHEDLIEKLNRATRPRRSYEMDARFSYEAILCELVRRGGIEAESALSRRLSEASGPANLELLTALRRTRRQPDPLIIKIDGAAQLEASTRHLPILNVEIENVDIEERDVGFKFGGNNRSGRHDRWRIHVRDSNGRLLPERPRWSSVGGGLFHSGPLSYGKTWKAQLALASYVGIRDPGKYEVQVLYHNTAHIADIRHPEDLDSLILFRSEPFELHIESGPKVAIRLQADSKEKTLNLLNALDENNEVCLLLEEYNDEAHDFVDPGSPQGQILTMNWQAVPGLIDGLQDPMLSFRKRAWILALLASIVRDRDLNPATREGALPVYRFRGTLDTWVTSESGASSGSGFGTASSGWESVAEQLKLAREWLKFRDDCLDLQVEE